MDRPLVTEIEQIYNELFSTSTLDSLITSALYGRLFHDKYKQENVTGRSMIWKLFLCPQPPLTNNLSPNPVPPLAFLRDVRMHHMTLLRNTGLSYYHEDADTITSSRPIPPSSNLSDWSLNNPLSLDSSNPWHAYFSAAETRQMIRQDVQRAFPEISYFRQTEIQNAMTNILFLYAQRNGDIGYRQGMHELLACVYRVVDYDAVGDDCSNPQLQEFCSSSYVAADAHALFELIMKYMEPWYEWQPSNNVDFSTANETPTLEPYVAPIIKACVSLRDEKLRLVDPYLWEKLREGGIEPQIYGMRWLRLLFTREFSFSESMILWDGLFASVVIEDTPSSSSPSINGFGFTLWIGVAMLMRIRNYLISGNYTDQLTYVLRYPSIPSAHDTEPSNVPSLLLMQARSLMTYPNPSTGVSIMMQNRSELGVAVQSREPGSPKQMRDIQPTAITGKSHSPMSSIPGVTLFDKQGLPTKIHRILDGNDSLGIQRGFRDTLGAISDFRKNLPDISHAITRNSSWHGSSISLHNGHSNSSTLDKSSASEEEGTKRYKKIPSKSTAELRGTLRTLGEGMEWALDALLSEATHETRDRRHKAVACLRHVKEVLLKEGQEEINPQCLLEPASWFEGGHGPFKGPSSQANSQRARPSLAFVRHDDVGQGKKLPSQPPFSSPGATASNGLFALPQSHLQKTASDHPTQSDPLGVLS